NALVRFAVLGDYGFAGPAEAQVAELIKGWKPEFVLTTGDNNYPDGSAETIDANIGQFFREFICPYRGKYGAGSKVNRFFPALGNHDWYTAGARPYLDYFTLPGNERYYDLLWGSVHVFVIDSDPNEPDGVESGSRQAKWLEDGLRSSKARWQLVTMHHPPFSSGPHMSNAYMQWPYKEWGADLVLGGHDHDYERFERDGLTCVVIGLGGASIYEFGTPAEGSSARFNANYGAALVEADSEKLVLRFYAAPGQLVDTFTLK
ncbi:MAG TPA: metallophosphoesterase, partial [Polyangiaceae bacterium]|nr:metallophosphoesterase [Polyangiaceae bacterium]